MILTHIPLVAALVAAATLAPPAAAEGGKNRLGDDLIEEGYTLCQMSGVTEVTLTNEEGTVVAVIDCTTLGPQFPGAGK